ncbi:MAG: hypothetical protein OXN90_10635 [Gemmatimonadota bacterium]|nr:hypothetical protein [Gemmatimonadota bacterium]
MEQNEREMLNRDLPQSMMGELDAIYFYINFLQLEILNHLSPDDAKKIEAQLGKDIEDKLQGLDHTAYSSGYRIGLRALRDKLL